MSSDNQFIDSNADVAETNLDVAQEDKAAEESEISRQVSSQEVQGLKDEIGGGQVLDDGVGYTRSSNKDAKPMQQEEAVDAAIDNLE